MKCPAKNQRPNAEFCVAAPVVLRHHVHARVDGGVLAAHESRAVAADAHDTARHGSVKAVDVARGQPALRMTSHVFTIDRT
jgi:hypothetical protein